MVVVQVILWVLLMVSIFLLIGVILLQEGKGGGLAEAFGGVGAETFGVKAAGINKFTSIVGGAFLALCVVLTLFKPAPSSKPAVKDLDSVPNFNMPPRQAPPPNPIPDPLKDSKPADSSKPPPPK